MSGERQCTIGAPFTMEGIGLHTGRPVRLTARPGEPGQGIRFRRLDLPGTPVIPAAIANVVEVLRGTTLGVGEARVHTVEHLMAGAYGLGIDNLWLDLDGPEPPAMDGSARPFAEPCGRRAASSRTCPEPSADFPRSASSKKAIEP
jgi:UDP-3-O-[3-hydroxymyristoyl] N-acetylglucosamine deacetylase/3-hydroxyacyl-[acyl-carrier-protein] dehydratase